MGASGKSRSVGPPLARPGDAGRAGTHRLRRLLNVGKSGKRGAMGVINVDPHSSKYGQFVGQLDFPNDDSELHHFGWNACSACLCPQAPHPHMERRGSLRRWRIYTNQREPFHGRGVCLR